jgi:hypothetical protein
MFTNYRGHVPDDDTSKQANVEFYTNRRASAPQGDGIDNIYAKWFGDFRVCISLVFILTCYLVIRTTSWIYSMAIPNS